MYPHVRLQGIPAATRVHLQNNSLIMSLQIKAVTSIRKTAMEVGNSARETAGSQPIRQVPALQQAPVLPQQDPQHNPLLAEAISTGRLQAGTAVQQEQTITRLLQDHQPAVTEEECPEQVVVDFQEVAEEEEDSRKSIYGNRLPEHHLSGRYLLSIQ